MPLKHKVFLVAFFLALTIASWIVWEGSTSDETRLTSSTYSAGPRGARALYLVLEEMGVGVKTFRRSYPALEGRRGTLVVYDPKTVPIGKREAAKLKAWVEKGNRLVIIAGRGSLSRAKAGSETWRDAETLGRLLRHFGLSTWRGPDSGRKKLSVELPGVPGTLNVSVENSFRWNPPRKGWHTLMRDDLGLILLSKDIGKGTITALCDPTVFSNQYIREEQNLRLALAVLLGQGRPNEVLFDEYHHGHTIADNFWGYVGSSVFSWILLQTVVGLGLFFYSRRGYQVGRYRSLALPTGRSSMEYIQSMANVLESCKAGSAALEAVLTRFVGKVSRRFGISVRMLENGRWSENVSTAGSADEVASLIRECRNAVKSGGDSDRMVTLARRLAEMQQRIMHAGRKS